MWSFLAADYTPDRTIIERSFFPCKKKGSQRSWGRNRVSIIRMYERRYFFHRCLSVHTCGRGVPHPRSERGVPHSRVWTGGYSIPGLDGGTLGYPLPRTGWGHPLPIGTGWDTPSHPGLDGVPPTLSRTEWGIHYPLGDRAAQRALATWRAVCVLRDFLVWTGIEAKIF